MNLLPTLLLLWFGLVAYLTSNAEAELTEISGFHCMMRHSMRMNRRVHGAPQKADPPFEFHFLDSDGQTTAYYEPGKVYTVRLVGFVHYRGLLLQSRLTNENGFLLGSLKGGRFLESPAWSSFGIRLQECDLKMSTADSVTHADDSRKFLTQLKWTSDYDVGAVQFMMTIAEEDEIYWERWRPRSAFIQPISFRGRKIPIISEVFTDEQAAMRLADHPLNISNTSSVVAKRKLHGIKAFTSQIGIKHPSVMPDESASPLIIFGRLNRTAQFKQHLLQKKQRFEETLRSLYAARQQGGISDIPPPSHAGKPHEKAGANSHSHPIPEQQTGAAPAEPHVIPEQTGAAPAEPHVIPEQTGAAPAEPHVIPEQTLEPSSPDITTKNNLENSRPKPEVSIGTTTTPTPVAIITQQPSHPSTSISTSQFVPERENLRELMRLFKNDLQEMHNNSSQITRAEPEENALRGFQRRILPSEKVVDPFEGGPTPPTPSLAPSLTPLRAISQSVPNRPVNIPLETGSDLKNSAFEKTASSLEKSDPSLEKSDPSLEKSDPSLEKSDPSLEKSDSSFEKPVSSLEKPTSSLEKPTSSLKKPTSSFENTTPGKKPGVCSTIVCMNGGACVKDRLEEDGYRCECRRGWTGIHCEGDCGVDFCKRNGSCFEKKNGDLGCECPAGSFGKFCEKEINECNFQRCKNSVKCIDKWNNYECICKPGWMGKNCDRPCQDIYGSCNLWKRQGQCDLMREHTDFYDKNCASACDQCTIVNETIITRNPLSTHLLPLSWLIGVWKAEVNGTRNRTVDYPIDFEGTGYEEVLEISVQAPLMFGTASLNFTSIAVSKTDPSDKHVMNGFVTIRNHPGEVLLVGLSSVTNTGLILIEEGSMRGTSVLLKPQYSLVHPLLGEDVIHEMSRTFLKNGDELLQTINKKGADGRNKFISKHYKKIRNIDYL